MTFLQLVIKNAWRNPIRTSLLIVCVATTFLIYGLASSFVNGSQGAAGSSEDILGVMNAAGMGRPMPKAYVSRIETDQDVAAVAYSTRVRGYVENERNAITLSVSQPEELMAVQGDELGLNPELAARLAESRDHVLAGKALAEAQGWIAGQTIGFTTFDPLRANGNRVIQLKIAGIFEGKSSSTDTYFLLGQYDYINALRLRDKDTADVFVVRPREGAEVAELAVRLDEMFKNSSTPTRTQSEKQFLEAFLRQYADVGLIVQLVVAASFVSLLMIVVNTMILAVRERYFEIGVLKTLGFSQRRIMVLIMSQTVFVFLVGGMIGLMLSLIATMLGGAQLGLVLSPEIVIRTLAIVLTMALIAGFLPTLKAMRISVVKALRAR